MPADMHEFQLVANPSGPSAILTSYRAIPYDLSKFKIIAGQGWLLEGMFQEIDVNTGRVLFEWYSTSHVGPASSQVQINSTNISGDGLTPGTAYDYFHINSVDKSKTSGNYLVSGRHTSIIYYINSTDQSVIWQLSSQAKSDLECSNFNFSSQHDVRVLSETDTTTMISMFDNANDCYTRTRYVVSGVKSRLCGSVA